MTKPQTIPLDSSSPLVLLTGNLPSQTLNYIAQPMEDRGSFLLVIASEFEAFGISKMTDQQIIELIKDFTTDGSDLFSEEDAVAVWEQEGGVCL